MTYKSHRIYSSTWSIENNGVVVGYVKRTPVSNIKTDTYAASKDRKGWVGGFKTIKEAAEWLEKQ